MTSDTGEQAFAIAGELLLMRQHELVVQRPNGDIAGWHSSMALADPITTSSVDSDVVAWLDHLKGFFVVLADGRWLFYSVPTEASR